MEENIGVSPSVWFALTFAGQIFSRILRASKPINILESSREIQPSYLPTRNGCGDHAHEETMHIYSTLRNQAILEYYVLSIGP